MSKNIVFVLHGIGEYDANWLQAESTAVHALREAVASGGYEFFSNQSLDTYVEFVPVLYDDVFTRVLQHWNDLGEGLDQAIPAMPEAAGKVVKFLKKTDDDKWEIKKAGDVLLYWGFRLFRQRVHLRVLAQITNKVAATINASEQRPAYHILAHGMGTAVAHNALHHLGTEDWLGALERAAFDDSDGQQGESDHNNYRKNLERLRDETGIANPFHPREFQFETVTMLCNLSALLQGVESPYRSIVRPGSASAEGACTRSYMSVNHKYDPISIAGSFKMPSAWKMQGGTALSVEHVMDKNIHSAAHYVTHPDVHLRLLQWYVDPYFVSEGDARAIGRFKQKHNIGKLADRALKQKIEALKERGDVDIDTLVAAINKLEQLIKA